MKMPILKKTIAVILSATASLHALPLDLSAPSPALAALDRDGTLLVVDDLREADFGNGLRLPVRWVYRSSDESLDSYGWAGFNLTILEARAAKLTGALYAVTMLGGKVEYFNLQANQAPAAWKSNDTEWTGVEDGTKFTITRWDGWEIEFREGRIYRLKTDDNRTLRWEYESAYSPLVTRIYEPATGATTVAVGLSDDPLLMYGSSTIKGAHTLTVNGDAYTFAYANGTLKDVQFPDGRKTQWNFTSVPVGKKRLTLTQETGWWRSWVFGDDSRRVETDDFWSYTVTGGEPALDGVVYNRPTVLRTRLTTSETERYSYEASNSIEEKLDVLGNLVTTYRYKTTGKLYDKPFKIERKKAAQSTVEVLWRGVYDAATGDLISSFDALNNQTSFAYERFPAASEFQPPKKVAVTGPMGRTRSIERDLQGDIIEVVDTAGVKRKLEYDSRHRVTRVKNAANDVLLRFVYGDNDQVLERYDARGNKTGYEYSILLGTPLLTKITTPEDLVANVSRDSKGRITAINVPSGAEWKYGYVAAWNAVARITDPLNAETNFEYDTRLNQIEVTDPLNRITRTAFDDLDLPSEVTNALNAKTKFENNGNRNMKKLTDARNNTYQLAWDSADARKSLEWPDSDKQTSIYNANGLLTQWKAKANAGTVDLARNDAGEVTGRTWTAGSESGSVAFTRNSFGQITGTSATTMSISVDQSLAYNAEGQLSSLSQTVGNVIRTAGVTYDLDGRVDTITYPVGFVVAYEYNKDGQIKTIKKDGSLVATYAYDTGGRLSTRTLASGVVTTYTYDGANRLASIFVASGSTILWAERYGYNAAGERTFTLKGSTGTAGDGYWLDATSQLRGVKVGSPNATLGYTSQNGTATEWQYDEVGNRIAEVGSGGITTYVSDNVNQYLSVSSVPTVTYSDRGDMTQFGNWSYTYDAQGNLIRAHNSQRNTLAKYWRDANGHRAVKDVDGSKIAYFNIGTMQLEAYNVTNATASSTIYEPGIDRPIAEVSSSGSFTAYHQDILGNVCLLTNTGGLTVESYTYDVWGKVSAISASGALVAPQSRFLFTAREFDPETKFYHYRARAYSAEIGRFLQVDPIDFGGGDVNISRYVLNSPVNFIDPTGEGLVQTIAVVVIVAIVVVIALPECSKVQQKAIDVKENPDAKKNQQMLEDLINGDDPNDPGTGGECAMGI